MEHGAVVLRGLMGSYGNAHGVEVVSCNGTAGELQPSPGFIPVQRGSRLP